MSFERTGAGYRVCYSRHGGSQDTRRLGDDAARFGQDRRKRDLSSVGASPDRGDEQKRQERKQGATLSRSQQLTPNPFIVLVLSLITGETITRKTRSLRCCGKGIAGLPVSFRFQSTGVAPCEHASGR